MESKLFSVIIPIYNVEVYLPQCIESIITQTYKNLEIILVDDGSFDNSPDICDTYAQKDKRIVVVHKENGGLVSARKAGANIAKGDYIVCVDGDDWIGETYIERFVGVVEKYSADIVVSGFIKSKGNYNKNILLPQRKGFYSRENIVDEIFPVLIQGERAQYFAPSVWAKAFNSNLYKKMQYEVDNRIKIGEDGACTIPCIYNAESIFVLDDCEYYYRQNPESMTKERKAFDINGPKLIYEHLSRMIDLDRYNFRNQLYLKIVHELFTVVLSQFNRTDGYKKIKKDLNKCLSEPVYAEAIKNAKFQGLKGEIAVFILKFKCYRIAQVMNYIRRYK